MKKPVNKICKDCKWFRNGGYDEDGRQDTVCKNPNLPVDIVYGIPLISHPVNVRANKKLCGMTGKWHTVVEKLERKFSWPWC